MPGRTQHSTLCELYWILLNYIEFSWIILNYIELYWIILNYVLMNRLNYILERYTLPLLHHFHPFPSTTQFVCSNFPWFFPSDTEYLPYLFSPGWVAKKTLWLPIHMPRSLTLHCKETFDDPFRTSQTLAALAAEGADERSLQELARRFQRTLAADREAKSGAKWELTCKTWDWSNLIVRIDLSIYLSIYICVCVMYTSQGSWHDVADAIEI